jgi:hypothetical protein
MSKLLFFVNYSCPFSQTPPPGQTGYSVLTILLLSPASVNPFYPPPPLSTHFFTHSTENNPVSTSAVEEGGNTSFDVLSFLKQTSDTKTKIRKY